MGGGDNRRGCACVSPGDMWDISIPSAQFYYEAKTSIKYVLLVKTLFNKQNHKQRRRTRRKKGEEEERERKDERIKTTISPPYLAFPT